MSQISATAERISDAERQPWLNSVHTLLEDLLLPAIHINSPHMTNNT